MINLIKELESYKGNNPKKEKELVSHFVSYSQSLPLYARLEKGMKLIQKHLPITISDSSVKKINTWLHRFDTDLNQKIDQEIEMTLEKGPKAIERAGDDLTCLKDVFGLEDVFMEDVFTLGQKFLAKKEFAEAANLFSVLTLLDPLSAESMLCLGLAESGLGNKADAERILGVSLFLNPHSPSIIYHVGNYYLNAGDTKTAKGFFKSIIDSKESTPQMKDYCRNIIHKY